MTGAPQYVESWGRLTRDLHHVVPLHDRGKAPDLVRSSPLPGLPYGNGRSYGDVCLNPRGTLWTTRGLDRFLVLDPQTGVVECEAGVLLKDLIDVALPRGWFPPVVPGTQFVTVGGAIANDVHGKSHHAVGSFGHHVLELELLRTDGSVLRCSPQRNADYFAATVGGLGLTGIITRARIQLRAVPGPWLEVDTIPFDSLEAFFELSNTRPAPEYSAAWLHPGPHGTGKGILFRANHFPLDRPARPPKPRKFPFTPPIPLVNRLSAPLFNDLYYHLSRARHRRAIQHYARFLFPLDAMLDWNRLYGRRGFFQYQCAIPSSSGLEATRAVLREIHAARVPCALAVLKVFGSHTPIGMLSFPMPGVTLAVDVPNTGEHTLRLFSRLHAIVSEAAGRVYPAKDACMPRELFERGYQRLHDFLRYRDPGISSALSRRLLGY